MINIKYLYDIVNKNFKDNDIFEIYETYQELNDILIDMPYISQECLDFLLLGLKNSCYLVRFTALEPFEIHYNQTPLDIVADIFELDINSQVRGEAAYVLACTGNDRFIPILKENLRNKRGGEKIHILIGLIKLGEVQYFPSLLKTFEYKNHHWLLVLINLVVAESDIFNDEQKNKINKKLIFLLGNIGEFDIKKKKVEMAILEFDGYHNI